jgi:hypothetical protein
MKLRKQLSLKTLVIIQFVTVIILVRFQVLTAADMRCFAV